MSDAFTPRVGGTLSADIAVPDHERVLRFYSRVLTTGENPLWREDLMNNLGMPVIGLGARTAEHDQLPVQWMPHIQVADVAASVKRALKLDGIELMHGKDGDGMSQWAVLQDPNGAAFGIIPVVSAEDVQGAAGAAGAEAESTSTKDGATADAAASPGCIAWLDLTVPDAAATREFYRQVVGWTVEAVEMDDAGASYADYNMCAADGAAAAGVCHGRGVNQGLPPVWMIYLPVGDLETSLRRVEEEGGSITRATRAADGSYVCAVIQDPAGAWLALAPG